ADDGTSSSEAKPGKSAQFPSSAAGLVGVQERDTALEGEIQPFLGMFFEAYAHGDRAAMSRFTDGTPIGGLADSVSFVQVKEVVAPKGPAGQRTVTATVVWQVLGGGSNGQLDQGYQLTMVKKGAAWYVRDIRGATEPGAS
ncbi:conjugal transfer protein, partial [Actinomadura rubrisoli]